MATEWAFRASSWISPFDVGESRSSSELKTIVIPVSVHAAVAASRWRGGRRAVQ
jgi:hypothetical protein